MKAIVCEKFGKPDVLKLREIEKPIPQDDEVLIRNYASSINTVDIIYRGGGMPRKLSWTFRILFGSIITYFIAGFRKPKKRIPGFDFAGEIVSVGKSITNWKEGDKVYGYTGKGTCAEYVAIPAKKLAKKPENVSYQEAGAVPGGAPPAVLGLKDLVKLEKGQQVLIIGASGGVGTFAVQIAKHVYETEVTAVCGPNNIELVKNIGADHVIDYTKGDYTKNQHMKYDVIFDTIGANSFSRCKKILTPNGIYVSNNIIYSKRHLLQIFTTKFGKKKLKFGVASGDAEVMNLLREWVEAGKIHPVIDSVFPLEQTAEAHRRYETGHAKGRVVISIA